MRYAFPIIALCVGLMLGLTSRMQALREAQLNAGMASPEPLLLAAIAAGRTENDEPTSDPPLANAQ